MAKRSFHNGELIATWRTIAEGHTGAEQMRFERLAAQLSQSAWVNQRGANDRAIQLLPDGKRREIYLRTYRSI